MRGLSTLLSFVLIGLMAFVFVPQADASLSAAFQSTAVLQGRVFDQNGAVVSGARISAQNTATGLGRSSEADSAGSYQIASLSIGNYRMEVSAAGFKTEIVEHLNIEVAPIVVQDFRLEVGDSGSSRQLQFALKLMFQGQQDLKRTK